MSIEPNSALYTQMVGARTYRQNTYLWRALPETYLYQSSKQTPGAKRIIDFNTSDYISLAQNEVLRAHFLEKLAAAPDILGSGGSRLLVNTPGQDALEKRVAKFFKVDAAQLFNSGYDGNVGFFASIPQAPDAIVMDEYIHASVLDGVKVSRIAKDKRLHFKHNDVTDLKKVLTNLLASTKPGFVDDKGNNIYKHGKASVFVSVEALYSMEGTFCPLVAISNLLDEMFPHKNAYLTVDEAHSAGVYSTHGQGIVDLLGLEKKVFARLVTFGKAISASGAVVLTNNLVRDHLVNFARTLIFTTSLSLANIVGAEASFDLLENGYTRQLSDKLFSLANYLKQSVREKIVKEGLPHKWLHLMDESLLSIPQGETRLPSPIIALMSCDPISLSEHFLSIGIYAPPIVYPAVPPGHGRVRVCVHAANTKEEVDLLVDGAIAWAKKSIKAEEAKARAVQSKM